MTAIYTIGYEGSDIDRFIAVLKAVRIKTLADVRAVAVSRKKGFSKTVLSSRLREEGVEYLHFMALGDPREGREAARSGRYDDFRRIYSKHLSESKVKLALNDLEQTAQRTSTCLLCFERDPKHCHRSLIASEMKVFEKEVFDLYCDPSNSYFHASQLPHSHTR